MPEEPTQSIAGFQSSKPTLSLETSRTANLQSLQRIVLTGFMGAGKTTVGKMLAERLGWQFLDADAEMEAEAESTISEIFRERGEAWFRQYERETILRLLASESLILALGGGAIEDDRTRSRLLNSDGLYLVHLEASLKTVLDRCLGTESLRPVLQDRLNLENRYRRRLPLYRESHLTIAVDSIPPGAFVETILDHLEKLASSRDDRVRF